MTMSIEVRMERMDSKLEKHIGITETILKNQQETLSEIRDIVKEHSHEFISHDEVELMEFATLSKASDNADKKIEGFEKRMDKKLIWAGGTIIATLTIVFGLLEILPLIKSGG